MPNKSAPPDERPASPPLHQSLWFPVAPESAPEISGDETAEPPPRPAPAPVVGLGWRAPSRVRVPVFRCDAAADNTTPAAAPEAAGAARAPTADDEDDPDFQEVASGPTAADCAARFQGGVNFAPPDQIPPPKGAESAQAPADPCGRDDATPNEGVVPPGIDEGSGERFCCALWSNGTFTICPSDGDPLVLNAADARLLVRYVSEVLSARARAAA